MRNSSCKSCGDDPADVCELLRDRFDGVLDVASLLLALDVDGGMRRLFEPDAVDAVGFLPALADNFGWTAVSGLDAAVDSPPVVDVDDVFAAPASSELLSELVRAFSEIVFSPRRIDDDATAAVRFLQLPR